MKIISVLLLTFVAALAFATPEELAKQQVMHSRANAPISFTRNDGQIDTHGNADCRFTTSVGGANYFFCADGMMADYQKSGFETRDSGLEIDSHHLLHEPRVPSPESRVGHVLKLNFLARTNFLAEVRGENEQEYKCNYFIGSDASKWHTRVPNYSRIVYKDVWQGVDVVYYGDATTNHLRRHGERSRTMMRGANASSFDFAQDDGAREATNLKYDVIVHPGANPNQIQFSYEGQDALSIDSKGNLVLKTSVGDVIEQTPYVYQIIDGKKKEISSHFIFINSEGVEDRSHFTFALENYDKTTELIIDPGYCTYLGGNTQDNCLAIALDDTGNTYLAGGTHSPNFPTTPGAYQRTNGNGTLGNDILFVAKLSPTGQEVYGTYFGGTGASSTPIIRGIAVDKAGNAFIVGITSSAALPTTTNSYQPKKNDPYTAGVFIFKFNSSGESILYGTYLGVSDDFGTAIALDSKGNIYVTGNCQDPAFPTTAGAYQTTFKGTNSCFVSKINPANQGTSDLIYSTFLSGATGSTLGLGIAVDIAGNAYVCGSTSCYDFPTMNAYQTPSNPNKTTGSAFVTKFNASGSGLLYSTVLSGTGSEQCAAITIDSIENAYVTGYTTSSNFPVTIVDAFQSAHGGGGGFGDAFVSKINTASSGQVSLVYSSFLGGTGEDIGKDIAVDGSRNIYVAGYTTPGSGFPVTSNAFQNTYKGGSNDAFMTKINTRISGVNGLVYSTFLGGSDKDYGNAIAFDQVNGNALLTGQTFSTDFPTTIGAFQRSYGGGGDAYVKCFPFTPRINVVDSLNLDSVYCTETQSLVLIENISADIVLKIDTITISGVNASNFSFVASPTFPIIVSPLGDTQFVVQLKRVGSAGRKTAFLNIHSNDDAPGSDTLKRITLIGVIDSIGVLILEKNITFPKLYCNDVAKDTIVRVKNKGLQAARVVPTVSGDGATSFTVTPPSATVAAGSTGNFTVHFQPSGNGSFSAHIKFSDDACEMISDTTYVTGSKISDVSLTSSPSLLDFGEHCHSSFVDSFITVHNTSNAAVTLDPAIMTGNGFKVDSPITSVTLGPGSSVRYHVSFTSSGPSNYEGNLTVTGKPCNLRVSHQLRGTEIEPPKITLSPKTVFFDTLDCSETERFTKVKVKNVGGRTITLKPVIIGDTRSYHAQPESVTIPKNSSFNVKIIFHPDSVGQHAAYLFFDDMLCGLLKDSISVRGFKKSVGAIAGIPLSLGFDTMNCSAGERDTMSLWIKNTGDQVLNLNTPTVSGNGFIIENANGVLGLAHGDSVEYRIIFYPYGEGTYLDTFRITGTCNVLFSCPLTGVCSYTFDVAEKEAGSAKEFFLGQNHPNPFSHSCQLSVVSRQSVKFEIRDMLGRVVYQRSVASATTHGSTEFIQRNEGLTMTIDRGELPNGVYLYTITDGVNIRSRMMTVMK